MAKQLDPKDPTPWFYDAILKQTQNRPVEALQDLQKSIELNDNRAVYRSRLNLDEDQAARSANIARIYEDLGFSQLAIIEGSQSLAMDPANYSAHILLADIYGMPLVVKSGLNSANVDWLGPTPLTIPALGNSDERHLYASGLLGSRDTLSDQLALVGVHNNLSFNLAHSHADTDGFGSNKDFRQDANGALIQAALSERLNIQVEADTSATDRGDIFRAFDPDNAANVRVKE